MNMRTHDPMAQAIIAANPTLALTVDTTRSAIFSSEAAVYHAAKEACLALVAAQYDELRAIGQESDFYTLEA